MSGPKSPSPDFDRDARLAQADARLRTGDSAGAEEACRDILCLAPEHGGALRLLSRVLLAGGRFHEALDALRRIAPAPNEAWVHVALGSATQMVGAVAAAVPHYRRALAEGERSPAVIGFLADCLRRSDAAPEAVALLQQAIADAPDAPGLREALGDALLSCGRAGEAAEAYRAALAAPGGDPRPLHSKLANLLCDLGEDAAARPHFQASMPWAHPNGATPAFPAVRAGKARLLILTAHGACNNRTKHIIDVAGVHIDEAMIRPDLDYPAGFIDQRYDVVFNSIADADLAGAVLPKAAGLADALSIPVLNPPAAILRTTREAMAERLAGLPHAIVPKTLRVRRAGLAGAERTGILSALSFPAILRPAGSHAGVGADRFDDAAALGAHLDAQPASGGIAEESYLTEFVDFRSEDGAYRKYRMIYIAGAMFPCHLSISKGWLNHYFRSEMSRNDRFRAEEQRFLSDPEGYFGPGIAGALREVGRRIDLDYFGIDCAVVRGRLLVFECNASMLVHMPYEDLYEYRRAPMRRIRDAFTAMLRSPN